MLFINFSFFFCYLSEKSRNNLLLLNYYYWYKLLQKLLDEMIEHYICQFNLYFSLLFIIINPTIFLFYYLIKIKGFPKQFNHLALQHPQQTVLFDLIQVVCIEHKHLWERRILLINYDPHQTLSPLDYLILGLLNDEFHIDMDQFSIYNVLGKCKYYLGTNLVQSTFQGNG